MEYNIANVRDKLRQFEKTGRHTPTFFYTPAEVQEALTILKGIPYTLSGGFEEAERRIIVIGTEDADVSEYLTVICIQSYQRPLTHRSVLGSVLGLGIKREMIGDIIVKDNICDIIIIREMKEYMLNQLRKVGSETVEVKEIPFSQLIEWNKEKEVRTFSVASLRLDAIISVAFGIAREKSSGLVQNEKVLVNYLPCSNNSKAIRENDLISVRGHGRIRVVEVVGETRKGRMRIKAQVY